MLTSRRGSRDRLSHCFEVLQRCSFSTSYYFRPILPRSPSTNIVAYCASRIKLRFDVGFALRSKISKCPADDLGGSETLDRGSDGRRSSRNLGLYALVIAFPETMSSSATIFQGAATYMPGKGQATACAGPEYICQRATIQHGQRPFVST